MGKYFTYMQRTSLWDPKCLTVCPQYLFASMTSSNFGTYTYIPIVLLLSWPNCNMVRIDNPRYDFIYKTGVKFLDSYLKLPILNPVRDSVFCELVIFHFLFEIIIHHLSGISCKEGFTTPISRCHCWHL